MTLPEDNSATATTRLRSFHLISSSCIYRYMYRYIKMGTTRPGSSVGFGYIGAGAIVICNVAGEYFTYLKCIFGRYHEDDELRSEP